MIHSTVPYKQILFCFSMMGHNSIITHNMNIQRFIKNYTRISYILSGEIWLIWLTLSQEYKTFFMLHSLEYNICNLD